jgi:hypothetical protein
MTAQQEMIEKYGEPSAVYQAKFCELWLIQADFTWFPSRGFLVNKDFKNLLFNAFTKIQAVSLQDEIKTFDGCYNNRSVRGLQTTSMHAWAAAIDLNALLEPMGQQTTHWTPDFLQIMKDAGLFWGGDFHNASRHDGMHFALLDG